MSVPLLSTLTTSPQKNQQQHQTGLPSCLFIKQIKPSSSHLIKRKRLIEPFSSCIVTVVSPLRGLRKIVELIRDIFNKRRDMFVSEMSPLWLKERPPQNRGPISSQLLGSPPAPFKNTCPSWLCHTLDSLCCLCQCGN